MALGPIRVGVPAPGIAGTVEAAYATFGADVRRSALSRVRDEAAAEDVVQEAFLRLHLAVSSGRAPSNIGGWLHRVAANLVASQGRRSRVAVRCASRLVSPEAISPEEVVLRHDADARLRAALAGLPSEERAVLVLAAAGLSGPEVALRLGRTHGASRALLCRARRRLRERLERLEAGT